MKFSSVKRVIAALSIVEANKYSGSVPKSTIIDVAAAYNLSVLLNKKLTTLIYGESLNSYVESDASVSCFQSLAKSLKLNPIPQKYLLHPLFIILEVENILKLSREKDNTFDDKSYKFETILSKMDEANCEKDVYTSILSLDNFSLSHFSELATLYISGVVNEKQ